MSEIRVTSAQLRGKRDELLQLKQKYSETVSKLESIVNTLNGSWEGESHDAFYGAFQRDKGQMNIFADTVNNYAAALEQIIMKYETAEANCAQIAQSRKY